MRNWREASGAQSLRRTARGKLSEDDAEALRESAQRGLADGFDDSDEGALTYLDHLLNGTIEPKYRHIVVDEAQDISPIEFKLLSAASVNNWFTVMGDVAQRLAPHRGIQRWGEVGRVLGRAQTTVQQARLSYRSNKRITRYSNRVLRLYEKSVPAPIPYEREGHRPEIHRHATVESMYEAVVNDLSSIRAMPGLANAGVAILARDQRALNRFRKFCLERGVSEVVPFGQERHHAGGAVAARITDVRGLEYDAVIALGVNETFSNTPFNQRLLYIAISRAKHYLALHWSGKQSPILAGVRGGDARAIDRRPRDNGQTKRKASAAEQERRTPTDEIAADGEQETDPAPERESDGGPPAAQLHEQEAGEYVAPLPDPADPELARPDDEPGEQRPDHAQPTNPELARSESESEEQRPDHAQPADPELTRSEGEPEEQRSNHAQPADTELARILADINDEPDEQAPAASKSGVLSRALRRGIRFFRRRG